MTCITNNVAAAYCTGFITACAPSLAPGEEENMTGGWDSTLISVDTMTHELHDPVGIAVDPTSGALFIAEPKANRIAVVMGRTVIGAFRSEFQIRNDDAAGKKMDPASRARRRHSRLRAPVDVAFDDAGRLFVAESAPGSRILAFDLRRDGFANAAVVSCSPPGQSRIFTSIDFDEKKRLCAISYDLSARNPSPLVEAYSEQPDGAWELVESGAWIEYPFTSKLVGNQDKAGDGDSVPLLEMPDVGRPLDPVLEWLYAHPSLLNAWPSIVPRAKCTRQ